MNTRKNKWQERITIWVSAFIIGTVIGAWARVTFDHFTIDLTLYTLWIILILGVGLILLSWANKKDNESWRRDRVDDGTNLENWSV